MSKKKRKFAELKKAQSLLPLPGCRFDEHVKYGRCRVCSPKFGPHCHEGSHKKFGMCQMCTYGSD